VAKAYFIRHPAIVNINVSPTGKMPELTEGVTPFMVADEEYQVEMDESQTSVCPGKPLARTRPGRPGLGAFLRQGQSGRIHYRATAPRRSRTPWCGARCRTSRSG